MSAKKPVGEVLKQIAEELQQYHFRPGVKKPDVIIRMVSHLLKKLPKHMRRHILVNLLTYGQVEVPAEVISAYKVEVEKLSQVLNQYMQQLPASEREVLEDLLNKIALMRTVYENPGQFLEEVKKLLQEYGKEKIVNVQTFLQELENILRNMGYSSQQIEEIVKKVKQEVFEGSNIYSVKPGEDIMSKIMNILESIGLPAPYVVQQVLDRIIPELPRQVAEEVLKEKSTIVQKIEQKYGKVIPKTKLQEVATTILDIIESELMPKINLNQIQPANTLGNWNITVQVIQTAYKLAKKLNLPEEYRKVLERAFHSVPGQFGGVYTMGGSGLQELVRLVLTNPSYAITVINATIEKLNKLKSNYSWWVSHFVGPGRPSNYIIIPIINKPIIFKERWGNILAGFDVYKILMSLLIMLKHCAELVQEGRTDEAVRILASAGLLQGVNPQVLKEASKVSNILRNIESKIKNLEIMVGGIEEVERKSMLNLYDTIRRLEEVIEKNFKHYLSPMYRRVLFMLSLMGYY